jgi:hypothetical protein
VITICLNSIVGTLGILGIREYRSPTKGRDFREGPLGRLTRRLGSLSYRVAPALAIASILVFAGGLLVEGKLVLQTDPIQWVNQHSQVIKDLNVLDKKPARRASSASTCSRRTRSTRRRSTSSTGSASSWRRIPGRC